MVELGLVLAVLGLLALAAVALLTPARGSREASEERVALASVDRALREFMRRENRLPCPDTTGSGFESASPAGLCTGPAGIGLLPHATLRMTLPPLSSGRVLRYGVWRQAPDADLAVRLPARPFDPLDAGGRQRFRDAALKAAGSTATSGQPFVASPDANGHLRNCGSASSHPAVVFSISPREGATAASTCFADTDDQSAVGPHLVAIGRPELLGWLQADIR